jgi:hypothetical protein
VTTPGEILPKNQIYRLLAGNPVARNISERAVNLEDQAMENVGIPANLFDFIIGHEDIKDLFWRSIKSDIDFH